MVGEGGTDVPQVIKAHGARGPIHQCDAINQKGRREGAQDQVFDPRLQRDGLMPLETGQDVKGDGDQFQGNKEQGKMISRCRKHHARKREQT